MASPTLKNQVKQMAILALLLTAPLSGFAHDTWIIGPNEKGVIGLSTGSHFPSESESSNKDRISQFACNSKGHSLPVDQVELPNQYFGFVIKPNSVGSQAMCYVVLKERQITLENLAVEQYLRDIKADESWIGYWSELKKNNKPWVEHYSKTAIKSMSQPSQGLLPVPLQIRVLNAEHTRPPRVGQKVSFQVLLNQKPLPNQSIELLVDQAPFGIWRRSDNQGILEFTLPIEGLALLRGTYLYMEDKKLHSHFMTYIFRIHE